MSCGVWTPGYKTSPLWARLMPVWEITVDLQALMNHQGDIHNGRRRLHHPQRFRDSKGVATSMQSSTSPNLLPTSYNCVKCQWYENSDCLKWNETALLTCICSHTRQAEACISNLGRFQDSGVSSKNINQDKQGPPDRAFRLLIGGGVGVQTAQSLTFCSFIPHNLQH